jgi:hypothetical protein
MNSPKGTSDIWLYCKGDAAQVAQEGNVGQVDQLNSNCRFNLNPELLQV